MKIIIIILFAIIGGVISCNKKDVGFLNTEYANYKTDSMIIRAVPDVTPPEMGMVRNEAYWSGIKDGFTPESAEELFGPPEIPGLVGGGEDYIRDKWQQPYVSTSIEGIEGTLPIFCTIKSVNAINGGDADAFMKQAKVNASGRIQIEFKNSVPIGRYIVTLNFTNEGYSKDIKDCFTVIVK